MKIKKYLFGALIGFCNGFFGSGGGIISVLLFERYFHFDEKEAHANAIAVIFPLTISGIIMYYFGGFNEWNITFKASLGGIIGAIIGAKLLSKLPKKYIKIFFGLVMIACGVRMFFM